MESIYDRITPWHPPESDTQSHRADGYVRYQIETRSELFFFARLDEGVSDRAPSLPPPHLEVSIKILVSLPPTYPQSAPPQLQLLSRYIGPFGVDSVLFGSILKTYISEHGVQWSNTGDVCIFDGLENVTESCVAWFEDHLSQVVAGSMQREHDKTSLSLDKPSPPLAAETALLPAPIAAALPAGLRIFEAEPIIDRKSSFVGRACPITHPSQVEKLI